MIAILGPFSVDNVLANINHRKVSTAPRARNSEKFQDRTLYLRARTFFVNDDLLQARMELDNYLARCPEDDQARALSDMIAQQIGKSVSKERTNTRAELLEDVSRAWKLPEDIPENIENEGEPQTNSADALKNKLTAIIIPHVRFINLPISSVLEAVTELSVQYDHTTLDETKKGVNVVLLAPTTETEPKINLNLRNISLERLLFYISQSANYRCECSSDAVIIGEQKAIHEQLDTRFFALSRATIIKLTGLQGLNHKSRDNQTITTLDEEQAIKGFLVRAGIDFSILGSNLAFDGAQLIVTNNLSNLRRLEEILQKYSEAKQVEIEAKFLEVTQGALDEFAFRWNVANRFDSTRGQVGTGDKMHDNLRTMAQAFPQSASSVGDGQIVTGGGNPVDIRNNPPQLGGQINLGKNSIALGSFLGVIDRAQIGMTIRALEQHSSSDLMSAPKLTVLSGRTANIVVAQELRYPQNYGEAHSGVGIGSSINAASSAGVTITAGTPRDFTTRNIGVEMKVTPIVEHNDDISLQLEPTVTEFEGFMEYGGMSIAVAGGTTVSVPSGYYQPIFSTRSIQTEVTVQNGATVIMGGLTREEVKEVRDKVPILGSIPLLGKLFRSRSETSQKRNLLIFVTARTVSPTGVRYRPASRRNNFDRLLGRTK